MNEDERVERGERGKRYHEQMEAYLKGMGTWEPIVADGGWYILTIGQRPTLLPPYPPWLSDETLEIDLLSEMGYGEPEPGLYWTALGTWNALSGTHTAVYITEDDLVRGLAEHPGFTVLTHTQWTSEQIVNAARAAGGRGFTIEVRTWSEGAWLTVKEIQC